MIRTIWLGFTFLIVLAGVGSFRFAFGHFDAANASGIVRPEVDPTVGTKAPQETSTKADRLRVAHAAPDDTELAKVNHITTDLVPRTSPAIVTPGIIGRHWHEPAPPGIRPMRNQKAKRKQAKSDAIASKSQLAAEPKACHLEEFDAVRWAFNLSTDCHT